MSVFYGEPKKLADGLYAVELRPASLLGAVLQEVKLLAAQLNSIIRFEFSGVTFKVAKDSNYFLLKRDWERALVGALGSAPVVGPYPEAVLSSEQIARYLKQKKEEAVRKVQQQRQADEELQLKQAAAKQVLFDAPPMQIIDQHRWTESKQQVAGDKLKVKQWRAAEQLARLIQLEMNNGFALEDCVETLFFQYGLSSWGSIQHYADILEHVWQYGQQLANWAAANHITKRLAAAK